MNKVNKTQIGRDISMTLYRFSPIGDKKKLHEAIEYVATQATVLCTKAIGTPLPITSLTIFAHYTDEFTKLTSFLLSLGEQVSENNGPYVQLRDPIHVGDHTIIRVRIRQPDPYRMQVGCCDYDVSDYQKFKHENIVAYPENLRLIVRPEYEMIELFDPDFDVLAYVVSE